MKEKADRPLAAKNLYVSAYFRKMRAVEATCDDWRILSALYGLVRPDDALEPYELTLKRLRRNERELWAARVVAKIAEQFPDPATTVFEIHAGVDYSAPLIPRLERAGYSVEVPLAGLTIGQRLQWYNKVRSEPALTIAAVLTPPQHAAELQTPHGRSRITTGTRTGGAPGADAFREALLAIFEAATASGAPHVDILSRDLHERVGGYGASGGHRMPTCCSVMRRAMQPGDVVLDQPPRGAGASLLIRYRIPRRAV